MHLITRLVICLALTVVAEAAHAQTSSCPPNQSQPDFTGGGNVFGFTAPQWEALFGAKTDTMNGCLTNPTIINPTIIGGTGGGGGGGGGGTGTITTIALSGTYQLPTGTPNIQYIIVGSGTLSAPGGGNILNAYGTFSSAVATQTNAVLFLDCTAAGTWVVTSQSGAWSFS